MPERGFSAEGRKGADKTANQICRLGKCCTGLGSYARREIRFSSKVYFAVRRSGTSNILRADPRGEQSSLIFYATRDKDARLPQRIHRGAFPLFNSSFGNHVSCYFCSVALTRVGMEYKVNQLLETFLLFLLEPNETKNVRTLGRVRIHDCVRFSEMDRRHESKSSTLKRVRQLFVLSVCFWQ